MCPHAYDARHIYKCLVDRLPSGPRPRPASSQCVPCCAAAAARESSPHVTGADLAPGCHHHLCHTLPRKGWAAPLTAEWPASPNSTAPAINSRRTRNDTSTATWTRVHLKVGDNMTVPTYRIDDTKQELWQSSLQAAIHTDTHRLSYPATAAVPVRCCSTHRRV